MYGEAEALSYQVCGEMSVLSSRIVINKGILLEEMGKMEDAFDYFSLGKKIKTEVKFIILTVIIITSFYEALVTPKGRLKMFPTLLPLVTVLLN